MKALWMCLPILVIPHMASAQSADDVIALRQLSTHIMQVRAATLGSAVALGQHLAVTNCHVLGDASIVYVMRGGLGSRATLQAGEPPRLMLARG